MRKLTLTSAALLAILWMAPATAQAGDWGIDIHLGGGRHHRPHVSGRVIVVSPPPRVRRVVTTTQHVHVHSDACRFIGGHHERRWVKHFVPGRYETRVRPAVYETRYDCACREYIRVLVKPAVRYKVWIPGYHERRLRRVWVPGRWVCVEQVCAPHRDHHGRGHGHRDRHDDHDGDRHDNRHADRDAGRDTHSRGERDSHGRR